MVIAISKITVSSPFVKEKTHPDHPIHRTEFLDNVMSKPLKMIFGFPIFGFPLTRGHCSFILDKAVERIGENQCELRRMIFRSIMNFQGKRALRWSF
jgi:hypothetical protein